MKLKKIARRLAGAMMAGTLMVSMLGMTAFAAGVYQPDAESSAVTSVPIGKTVTTDGNTYAPNTTFSFEVDLGGAEAEKTFTDGTKLPVYAGIVGGLTVTGTASYTDTDAEPSISYAFKGASLAVGTFEKPGIYHYVVKEKVPTEAYEGISYSQEAYDVYVYALNGDNGNIYVGYVETVKQGDPNAKGDLSFTNDYGSKNNTIHSVTITKTVEGTMADMTKGFNFTVLVNGSAGEKYKVVVKETASAQEDIYTAVSGTELDTNSTQEGTQPVVLKNGGTITIYGLSANDEYIITEDDYSGDGYTTYVDDKNASSTRTVSGKVTDNNATRTVYNVKNAVTPTGLILNIAPYILMVALAGILAFFFLRRRKSEF